MPAENTPSANVPLPAGQSETLATINFQTLKVTTNSTITFDDTLVRTNNTGNVTGISLTNLTAGSYTFLIKPEGFLQRKVAGINLNAGVNSLDLTTTILLAGDVSGDNFVNSVDYVPLMAKYLSSVAAGSPDEIYDLDGSGQINNLDFSLMLNNWNKSGEQ